MDSLCASISFAAQTVENPWLAWGQNPRHSLDSNMSISPRAPSLGGPNLFGAPISASLAGSSSLLAGSDVAHAPVLEGRMPFFGFQASTAATPAPDTSQPLRSELSLFGTNAPAAVDPALSGAALPATRQSTAPVFGSGAPSSMPAFGTSTNTFLGSALGSFVPNFGSAPPFGALGQSSASPAGGQVPFLAPTFGASAPSSQPAFGSGAPAFGAGGASVFGSAPAFGAGSMAAFGAGIAFGSNASMPTFGAQSSLAGSQPAFSVGASQAAPSSGLIAGGYPGPSFQANGFGALQGAGLPGPATGVQSGSSAAPFAQPSGMRPPFRGPCLSLAPAISNKELPAVLCEISLSQWSC